MTLNNQAGLMLPIIEAELKRQVGRLNEVSVLPFREMVTYHMGWSSSARNGTTGKRLRPLITLLVCSSVGGRWHTAVPAAAALELVHNFSLIHDDIQDNSPTRRGRATLWKKTGMPLAINAGDALFALATLASLDLLRDFDPPVVTMAIAIIEQACLDLTKGQFLDLHHQHRGSISLSRYWQMIDGKTAALLAACTHVGALLGGAEAKTCYEYRKLGQAIGRAFQVEDDILGIWGDEARTGKSAASDLVEGKLSLPVVYVLEKRSAFARLWRDPKTRRRSAPKLRSMLEDAGALEFASKQAARLTRTAINSLERLKPRGEAGVALTELATKLLSRRA